MYGWLGRLKADDVVVVRHVDGSPRTYVRPVEKVTKAYGGTLVVDGSLYDMQGWHRGRGHNHRCLMEATPENLAEVEEKKLREELGFRVEKALVNLSFDQIKRIDAIIREPK